ncbi:hypothetical protein phiAS5_ORF0236 [Aeromonas phage phiAS5]|uniref:Uncharacterized protein n=1 Tax=Aeromonas phage phiAS5 TaxID=879630 RepID=E1A1Z0_9CAUD|nr:hypothetical protein phiAS5_ORF0236 [Aeromonas phage phiAS5]ADM80079.1 hypothetical protein phiAS5_ORF0236 [Aeromonas phage phiAS5]
MSIRNAVIEHAIPGIQACPGARFTTNDIVDMLRENHQFNKFLSMYNRKDDKNNELSKNRWIETWERGVRLVFKQSAENIEHMMEKHGIGFQRYKHGTKTCRYWVFEVK